MFSADSCRSLKLQQVISYYVSSFLRISLLNHTEQRNTGDLIKRLSTTDINVIHLVWNIKYNDKNETDMIKLEEQEHI